LEQNYNILYNKHYSEGKYYLTSFRKQDLFDIKRWRNEQMDVLRQNRQISDEEQEEYYKNVIAPSFSEPSPKLILFSFLYKEVCIGYGGFTNISWDSKRTELSFLVNTLRTKDIMLYERDFTAFLTIIKKIAFCDLNFNRIFTETFAMRDRHIGILEKAGFRQEGVLREHVIINGIKTDSILHGLLRSEYV